MSDVSISVADGKIACAFSRDALTNLVLPNELGEATFDLNSVPYFLALATGNLGSDGNIAPHKDKDVSEKAFNF